MTDAPLTKLERWALELVTTAARARGRAPEAHDVVRHFMLQPKAAAYLRSAVRRLQRKGYIAELRPVVRPLRITARAKGRRG